MADIYPKPPSILQSINHFDEWARNVILRKADGTLDLPPGSISDTLLSDASTDIKQRFASHLADDMPHKTTDPSTNKVYRWGLAIQNGEWGIIYEEVV